MQIMPYINKASAIGFGIIFAIGVFALTHNSYIFNKGTYPEQVGNIQVSKDHSTICLIYTKANNVMKYL